MPFHPDTDLGDSPAAAGSRGAAFPISSNPFPLPPRLFAPKSSPWHSLSLHRWQSRWQHAGSPAPGAETQEVQVRRRDGRTARQLAPAETAGTWSSLQGSTSRQRRSREAGISLNTKQGGCGERKMRETHKGFINPHVDRKSHVSIVSPEDAGESSGHHIPAQSETSPRSPPSSSQESGTLEKPAQPLHFCRPWL